MYGLIRPLLFRLDAETVHHLTLQGLTLGQYLPFWRPKYITDPIQLLNLTFPNRIGLAAGMDKNGDYIDALASLGFGFIEVGTITPRPQEGQAKPRLFRLPESQAIINRMGFNNKGVDYLVAKLKKRRFQGIVGVNIGKNFDTPLECAVDDYLACLNKVYPYADYIVVNVSSPNTPGLRQLQQLDFLNQLLASLQERCAQLAQQQRKIPLAVKIAPDLTDDEIARIAEVLRKQAIEMVVATNTTVDRQLIETNTLAKQQGGLSGKPLTQAANRVIKQLRYYLSEIVIIGVGGVMSAEDALEKQQLGANLVQLYSGLVYVGPQLVSQCAKALHHANSYN